MRVAIFGLGYVGLTSAGCLVQEGHTIAGFDVSAEKIESLNAGKCPIFEPGLEELIALGVREKRLSASLLADGRLEECDVALVCVGTPSAAGGAHDMRYIDNVTREIAGQAKAGRAKPLTVVYRSTMRPGTMDGLVRPAMEAALGPGHPGIELVYNPEFLRESSAIKDYFSPPKIVIGTADAKPNANMDALYAKIEAPRFYTRFREAEITKFVDNSFHALKVAFANELGRICLKHGVSASTMHRIFISDTKLNISPYYLRPGSPFGGSCLPKDVRALAHLSEEAGADTPVIASLIGSNEAHKRFIFEYATEGLSPGASILLNGIAFKSNSDDLRESPQIDLVRMILEAGFKLDIHDSVVKADHLIGQNLRYSQGKLPSLADLLIAGADLPHRAYDRVIDARGNAASLGVKAKSIVDVSSLP